MQLIAPNHPEDPTECAYRPERQRQCRYFLAQDVSALELDRLLAKGWRKFGPYFFRPACADCQSCTPLRVDVEDFTASRSQKRIIKNGKHLDVQIGPLEFNERIFELYRQHARSRFGMEDHDLEDFLFSFYVPSCPGLQTSIYHNGDLIAVGWLDRGKTALSSVYFCFDPDYSHLNLGTFGALAELEYARQQGLPWYYLGYYIPGNRSTSYKDHFRPRQHYDWHKKAWQTVNSPPGTL
jgi:arginine-tRNA-protein transferase